MARPRSPRRRNPATAEAVWRPRPFVAPLLIIALAGAVYANSLKGPLIFDDYRTIKDNATIRDLAAALHAPAQTPVAGRPLANLSFAVNYAFGGYDVFGYHLVNLGIHILAGLALFGILRRLVSATPLTRLARSIEKEAERDAVRTAYFLALACSLAWVIHPLNTEAVNYITQRTESMVGFLYLFTLYAAIRGWGQRSSWKWDLVAVAANVCGLLTKESMLTAPLMVVLCDRVFAFPTFRSALAARYRLYAGLAAGWTIFLVLAPGTPFFAPQGFEQHVSPWTYLVNQAPIIGRYLRLSVWPQKLVLDYGLVQPLTPADVWPSALFLIALLIVSVIALVRVPTVGFWGAWFFVTLAPASSLIPIPTEVGAERRMYLPLIAVIVFLICAAWRWAPIRRAAPIIAPILAIALAAATITRNAEYRTGVSIWQTVLDRRPHPRAHTNIAVELREAGRTDEAVEQLRIAAPDDPEAKHVLASALLERGQTGEAIRLFQEFVRDRPSDPQIVAARAELAAALYRNGQPSEAVAEFRRLVSSFPEYALGRQNLANLLLSSNDWAGAAAEYREVLRIQPGNLFAATHLGLALAGGGQLDAGIDAFRHALQLNPNDATTQRALVDTLLHARRFADAEVAIRHFLSTYPNDAEGHNLLGVSLAAQGRMEEAVREFETAFRLNPQLREAQDNLGRAVGELRGGRLSQPR